MSLSYEKEFPYLLVGNVLFLMGKFLLLECLRCETAACLNENAFAFFLICVGKLNCLNKLLSNKNGDPQKRAAIYII